MPDPRLPRDQAERAVLRFLAEHYPDLEYEGDLGHDGDDGWSFGARPREDADDDGWSGDSLTGYVHPDGHVEGMY